MTDARFPERWLTDRRFLRLTADAFRTTMHLYAWSVSNRTDGRIDLADLALIPLARREDLRELVQLGIAAWDGPILTLLDYRDTQSSKEELDAAAEARRKARDRKRRQRAREATTSEVVTRDVTHDNAGQARTGQARTGLAPTGAADEGWPTFPSPGSPEARAAIERQRPPDDPPHRTPSAAGLLALPGSDAGKA
ncbi:hypothetical protein [Geodermatophilus sp. SYSU D00684]